MLLTNYRNIFFFLMSIFILISIIKKHQILQLTKLLFGITPEYYNVDKFQQFNMLFNNYDVIKKDVEKIRNKNVFSIHRSKNMDTNSKEMDDYINSISMKEEWVYAWSTENNKPNYKWLNYPLVYNNKALNLVPNNTIKILQKIGNIRLAGFSLMKANSIIGEHSDDCGLLTNSLTLHFGVDVPNNCYLKVNNKQENENNNKIIIFDSNYVHSAYNKSNQDRIILYVDFSISPKND